MTLDETLEAGGCVLVFRERYGGGWRALIAGDVALGAMIEGELTGGDIGAVEMQRYLGASGAAFPTSWGGAATPSAALAELTARLAAVPAAARSAWADRVREAWEALKDARAEAPDDEWWVGRAFDEGRLVVVA